MTTLSAYLFPGQGSHFVGMGRDVYEHSADARALFTQADARLGYAVSTLCFEGDEAALTATEVQQPALFVTSLAQWAVIEACGEYPSADYLTGHSLGEFAALTAAGSLSFADGLRLVTARGRLMQAAGQHVAGGMAAVLILDVEKTTQVCLQAESETGGTVQVANDNCPGQVVISGEEDALACAMRLALAAGARKVVRLPISIASHSRLMGVVSAEFHPILHQTTIHPPRIPVMSSRTAELLTTPDEIRYELEHQLTEPVRWREAILALRQHDVETFIEVGPGTVLTKLVKRIDRAAIRRTFQLPEKVAHQ